MTSKKRKKNNDNSLYVLLVFTCAVLVIALIGTVFKDYSKVVQNRKETKDLETRYQELLEEETSLNSEVVKLQDPLYIARYAREKYLYSRNGETILRIVDGSKLEKEKESSDQELKEEES